MLCRQQIVLRIKVILNCHGAGHAAHVPIRADISIVHTFQHLTACCALQAFLRNIFIHIGIIHILCVVQYIQKEIHDLHELVIDGSYIGNQRRADI